MSTLDRNGLEEQFNIAGNEEVVEPDIVCDAFEKEWENDNETENILRENIDRANAILDQVEDEMRNGNFSARLVEVAGQILNTVTNSVKEIQGEQHNKKYLLLKEKMLQLKKYEIEVKRKRISSPTNNNILITDRESILKILEDKQ